MLQFKKLTLSGFKSFVDSAELLIEIGLTGVVGPNGCGKSNLVEALRWSMGETSAKRMRGNEMEDVIFGGTDNRPARNIAEVILSVDNSQRSAPAKFNDYKELEISRKIERERGSTYKINGKEVRAKDVQLLFADSSTGARSTALVSQGQIGALINAKPTERRSLLEEAAGITGLHTRRHEAELRLKAAETNIERLEDVLITLNTQLQSLRKQSRQATRYRNLSDHIRKAEATLFFLLWGNAEKNLNNCETAQEVSIKAVDALTLLALEVATNRTKHASTLPGHRQKEAETASELHRLEIKNEGLEEEERRVFDAIQVAKSHQKQLNDDEERETLISKDANAAVVRLKTEKIELESNFKKIKETRDHLKVRLKESNKQVEMLDNKLNLLVKEVATSEAIRNSLNNRIIELTDRKERFTLQVNQLEAEKRLLIANSLDRKELIQTAIMFEKAQKKLEENRSKNIEVELKQLAAQRATQEAMSSFQRIDKKRVECRTEKETLTKILDISDEDSWTPILDMLTVKSGFEIALGTALGDDLSVPTNESAPVYWRNLPPFKTPKELPDKILKLSEVVKGPRELIRRLTQIGIVENDAHGHKLISSLEQGQRLVSQKGSLWRWDGYTVSSGADTTATLRLEQHNRLNDLNKNLINIQEDIVKEEEKIVTLKSKEETLNLILSKIRQDIGFSEKMVEDAREHSIKTNEALGIHKTNILRLEESLRTSKEELCDIEKTCKDIQQELRKIPNSDLEREDISQIRSLFTKSRNQQLISQSNYDTLLQKIYTNKSRLEVINSELQSWEQRRESSKGQLEQLALRKRDIKKEIKLQELRPAKIVVERSLLLTNIEVSAKERSAAADSLSVAENSLRKFDEGAKIAELNLAEAREQMVRREEAVNQAIQSSQAIAERAKDKINCSPQQFFELSGLPENSPIPETSSIERKVERLINERDTMGPVNLRAEEEVREINVKINTLETDRGDLLSAIEKLRQGILELNREGKIRLLESFKNVDAHFQKLFVDLFGGGRAYLTLTSPEDPLESGLEIMASPPGKNLQVLSLLSGGEQALTALSLLFAVFLTNPAPICVLDEVDAPLDDANVDRFCKMLEKMSLQEKTRFLIITHHRMTMARMDRLFGVTMSEKGISQLVSVDLQNSKQLRDFE